jgi:hydrogenase maturation protease
MKPEAMRVAVFGLGNVLMGDDGLGPFVVERFAARYRVPDNVLVEDLGTPGLDLIPFLIDLDAVIFVDTVRATGRPGDLRVYHIDEILKHAPDARMSPHDPSVKSALLALAVADAGPRDATLVGVIPSAVTTGPGLSDSARAAVDAAVQAIVAELARLGVMPTPREAAQAAAPWWEAAPTA